MRAKPVERFGAHPLHRKNNRVRPTNTNAIWRKESGEQHMPYTPVIAALASAVLWGTPAFAQDVRIITFKTDSSFSLKGRTFNVAAFKILRRPCRMELR